MKRPVRVLLAVIIRLLPAVCLPALLGQSNPSLNINPSAMDFSYQLGIAPPPVRLLFVTSSGAPIAFHVAASTSSGGNWLMVGPSPDGMTPANLTVMLNSDAIQADPPGTYNGSLTLTSAGASNSGVSVPVSLTISGTSSLTLDHISPNSATAGAPGFTLTATGFGFVSGATVQWNGSPLPTSFLSSSQLTATIGASLVANPGSANVAVANPGGSISNAVIFTINPATSAAPAIANLSPPSATAGGQAFTLTVNGSGYQPTSTVQWNGSPLPTMYGNGTQLTAAVGAGLIAGAGNASVTVLNPGGAVSNAMTFTVNPPVPVISALSPNSVVEGSGALMLTVAGSGFVPTSSVRWSGSSLATTYVNGGQLTASVAASLVASAGNSSITVSNPGGSISNAVTFSIAPKGSLSVTTASPLPSGTVGVSYSQVLAASGGVIPYKSWAVVSGNLPPGISLAATPNAQTGLLTGIPTTPGTYSFTVQVTDNANATASTLLSLTINPALPSIFNGGIVNAASYAGGGVAPGEIVIVSGSGFGSSTIVTLQLDSRKYVSTSLGGVQLLFDGTPAPLIYVQAGAVAAVVPYSVAGKISTEVRISANGQTSSPAIVPVIAVAPGMFTLDQSGRGPGAIINQDGTVNSVRNPAAAGSYVSVYATGEGQTSPGGVDGKPGDAAPPRPVQSAGATVGGASAQVQYAGGVYGLVAGVSQINVQIPQGTAAGGSIPITITFGGQATQSGVTVAVK